MVVDSIYSIYSERLDALSYTRKPLCLSAVAAVMICIKWIPSPCPASPCVQALQHQASLLRACGE